MRKPLQIARELHPRAGRAFPANPGIAYPRVVNVLDLLDCGPRFDTLGGIITIQPPVVGQNSRGALAKRGK